MWLAVLLLAQLQPGIATKNKNKQTSSELNQTTKRTNSGGTETKQLYWPVLELDATLQEQLQPIAGEKYDISSFPTGQHWPWRSIYDVGLLSNKDSVSVSTTQYTEDLGSCNKQLQR